MDDNGTVTVTVEALVSLAKVCLIIETLLICVMVVVFTAGACSTQSTVVLISLPGNCGSVAVLQTLFKNKSTCCSQS